MKNKNIAKRHIFSILLTVGIFVIVFLFVGFQNSIKRKKISLLQENLLIDLMANETQFDLLRTAPCESIMEGSQLSTKLDEIGKKLTFAENSDKSDELKSLKKYYTLLEIKDYMLSQEISKKCSQSKLHTIIYFYRRDCTDCEKQGFVLSKIKKEYPWVKIYSFDYDMDFPIVKTFADIYHIKNDEDFPILIVDGNTHSGFINVSEIEELIPELYLEKINFLFRDFLSRKKSSKISTQLIQCSDVEKGGYVCLSKEDGKEYSYSPSEDEFLEIEKGDGEEKENTVS